MGNIDIVTEQPGNPRSMRPRICGKNEFLW
jgi:hypothetical protein